MLARTHCTQDRKGLVAPHCCCSLSLRKASRIVRALAYIGTRTSSKPNLIHSSKCHREDDCVQLKTLFFATNKLTNKAKCTPLPASLSCDRFPHNCVRWLIFSETREHNSQNIDSFSNVSLPSVVHEPFFLETH